VSGGASVRPLDDADQIVRWYEEQGYEVLERKWSRREGEVDLIIRRAATVVFSQMTRPNDGSASEGGPLLVATQRRIHRLASRWLSEITPASGRARIEVRFDVATVTAGTVEVIEDAF
jgi:Holliday junction resolvase-like predicted endonuclease